MRPVRSVSLGARCCPIVREVIDSYWWWIVVRPDLVTLWLFDGVTDPRERWSRSSTVLQLEAVSTKQSLRFSF